MEKIQHPAEEIEVRYTVLVNGRFICETGVYDSAMERGLGIALYLKLDFVNTRSPEIIDKWTNGTDTVIVTKTVNPAF